MQHGHFDLRARFRSRRNIIVHHHDTSKNTGKEQRRERCTGAFGMSTGRKVIKIDANSKRFL